MSAGMDSAQNASAGAVTGLDVVVVGAGFAGMYLLHEMRRLGFSTVVIEAGEDVRGTW